MSEGAKPEGPMEREARLWHRPFAVVCLKAHYAGQGVGHDLGDEYTTTFTREEAEHYASILNQDAWNPDCWGVQNREGGG